MPQKVNRLFRQFRPEHYDLTLDINEVALEFNGKVLIRGMKVGRPSKRITLHQKNLKVISAKIIYCSKQGDQVIKLSRVNCHKSLDEVRLHSDNLMMPGSYCIELEFSGLISPQMHGIYPSYFEHKGVKQTIIASQFESHHAREAFPCIDEPEAKATFALTLITTKDLVVLSNTGLQNQAIVKDRLMSEFETSPKMSCYLLAFVCGQLHSVEAKSKNGTIIKSWASIAQPKDHLEFANLEAVKVLDFFTDYFKTPFPLKKLDNVALPDFESGAMENWGLITYRESALLADSVNRSIFTEQYVASVVAHEISHQWFGNLVTMRWWNDLWLNESFASIMEKVSESVLHPEWHAWEDFVAGDVLVCSNRDIFKDVQPVGLEVRHPDEINAIFDPAIVYAKGARLLSMLLNYLGEDKFRDGLSQYFQKYAYANTTGDDLWAEFSDVSGLDIAALMKPWLYQAGQPVVSLSLSNKQLKFSQKRFLVDGEDDSLWPIPLLSQSKLPLQILNKAKATINYQGPFPLLNAAGFSHYISHYEGELKQQLKDLVIKEQVDSPSRIVILNDMLLLARVNLYSLSYLLDIVAAANHEPRDAVWSLMTKIVGQAQILVDEDQQLETKIRSFKAQLAKYWYDKLGWQDDPSDDPNTKQLRTTILALCLGGDYPPAVKHALNLYDKAPDINALPAEQRSLILATVVKRGYAKDIEALKSAYTASHNPDIKMSIIGGLCSTRDSAVALSLIDWGLNKNGAVRPQDIATWFAYLLRNPYTRNLTWAWFVKSWDYIAEISGGGKYMDYFVWYSAGPLATFAWLKKYQDFFTPMLNQPSLKRSLLIAFSEIEQRAKWRERELKALKQYFKDY